MHDALIDELTTDIVKFGLEIEALPQLLYGLNISSSSKFVLGCCLIVTTFVIVLVQPLLSVNVNVTLKLVVPQPIDVYI